MGVLLKNPPVFKIAKTGQIISYVNYDDGYYETGNPITPRFIDLGNNSINDRVTGLRWVKDMSGVNGLGFDFVNKYTWANCLTAITALNTATYLGFSDWRMPNINEAQTLADYSTFAPAMYSDFTYQVGDCWSSTTEKVDTTYAFKFSGQWGTILDDLKTNTNWVRIVRGNR